MKSEIKRYLGVANVSDPRIDELIDKAIVMIKDTATVKYTSKIFDIIKERIIARFPTTVTMVDIINF